MVKKCTNCGLEIDKDSSEYCIRCGNKLLEKEEETQKNQNASIEKTHDPIVDNCYSGIKGLFLYACIGGILVFICIIFALFFLPGSGNSGSASSVQTTVSIPQTYASPASTPKEEATSDQFSNVEWIWSRDRWGDWQHAVSWSGSESGTNSEYGPVIVDDHGEHGTNTNLNGGSTQSSVWRTFTDPSGIGWNTLEFTGLLTATDTKSVRWMTIDVNDQQVFKGSAAQNPPGNGVKFTIKRSFPLSPSVKVKISSGQTSAYRPLFAMHYYSIKLSRPTTSQQVQPIQQSSAIPTPAISSTVDGDQAAIDKMTKMEMWINPAMQRVVNSGYSGDYTKMSQYAVLLRDYIDNNLPEMQQLADGASTKKDGAQEYVLFLKDIRTAADLTAQAADKHNSGDLNEYTALTLKTNIYLDLAQRHLDNILFAF